MATYTVHAINVASFPLGEADKVITLFSAEKGPIKAIAKGARKPGTKMAGRSEVLFVNELHLARGRTFEIITQAQTIESFSPLRTDLMRLSYSLYYAELTSIFGEALQQDSMAWFEHLVTAVNLQAAALDDAAWLSLEFQMSLLEFLGLLPELTFCVFCRTVLNDYLVSRFNSELGGIICLNCLKDARKVRVAEGDYTDLDDNDDVLPRRSGVGITPFVWKNLVLASQQAVTRSKAPRTGHTRAEVVTAAERVLKSYLEYKGGRKLKSLDFIEQLQAGT